jgi:hypothetical protein
MMHLQVVEDQEDLPVGVPGEPGQEQDEPLGIEGLPIKHETDFALISEDRDHAHAVPLGGDTPDRRVALRRVTPAPDIVGAHPGFVAPVDLGRFLLRPDGNARADLRSASAGRLQGSARRPA